MTPQDFYELLVERYGQPRKGVRLDPTFRELMKNLDEARVRYIMRRHDGHIMDASRASGIDRNCLLNKVRKFGIRHTVMRIEARMKGKL